jgi:hypothetical protein
MDATKPTTDKGARVTRPLREAVEQPTETGNSPDCSQPCPVAPRQRPHPPVPPEVALSLLRPDELEKLYAYVAAYQSDGAAEECPQRGEDIG